MGGGESGGNTKKAAIISLTGSSLAETRNLLSSVIAPSPSLSQIKVLIIGEELARQGVMDTLGAVKRFPEYRGSMFVIVTQGTAKKFLEENKPIFEYSPSKYYEIVLLSGVDSGYYLRTNLHQFYNRLKSNSGQPYATLAGINLLSGNGKAQETRIPKDKTREYTDGNSHESQEHPHYDK